MPRCFFFYGTLMAGSGAAVALAVHDRLGPGVPASVAGQLYAIADTEGWYPALVPGSGRVFGCVYEAGPDFGAGDLAAMDGYEACFPADPAGSDYMRAPVVAVLADGGAIAAQAYVWARDVPDGAVPIAGGDFAAFLRQQGGAAFGGGE